MQNQWPNTRALQGPIYTLAKMPEYVGLANYVVYASMKNVFQQNGSSCMIATKIASTKNRQYGGSVAAVAKYFALVYMLFN